MRANWRAMSGLVWQKLLVNSAPGMAVGQGRAAVSPWAAWTGFSFNLVIGLWLVQPRFRGNLQGAVSAFGERVAGLLGQQRKVA